MQGIGDMILEQHLPRSRSEGNHVERVKVESKYESAGESASVINDRAVVKANASEEAIRELMVKSDRQSEGHKTLRRSVTINMVKL